MDSRRSELIAEIASLQKQQFEANSDATYLGWTLEARLVHQKRATRIAELTNLLSLDASLESSA